MSEDLREKCDYYQSAYLELRRDNERLRSRLAEAERLLRWAESMTAVASVTYLEKVDAFLRTATPSTVTGSEP